MRQYGIYLILLTYFFGFASNAQENVEKAPNKCSAYSKLVSYFGGTSNNPQIINYKCDGSYVALQFKKATDPITISIPSVQSAVADSFPFFGFAQMYGDVDFYKVTKRNTERITEANQEKTNGWIGVVGRYKALLFHAPEAEIGIFDDIIKITWAPNAEIELTSFYGNFHGASNAPNNGAAPNELLFANQWFVFREISNVMLSLLIFFSDLSMDNWGLAIIFLGIATKIIFLPLTLLAERYEKEVAQKSQLLLPAVAKIKEEFKGEEAHEKITEVYEKLNISPFYSLKPHFIALFQIPLFIAAFSVLGETPQLQNASFLWIESLAYPDSVFVLNFELPLLGSTINLLPILMTCFNALSAICHKSPTALNENSKGKMSLLMMAIFFLVLLFPFPAAVVLYWTTSNLVHLLQQLIRARMCRD